MGLVTARRAVVDAPPFTAMSARSVPRDRALRRLSVGAVALAVAVVLAGCGAPGGTGGSGDAEESGAAKALVPVEPTKPIPITVIDGAGDLDINKPLFDQFVADNPDLVSEINYEKAAAPDVAGKVHAQQSAGMSDISIVLGGLDVLGSLSSQDLMLELLPEYKDDLIDLGTVQDSDRKVLQDLADGHGVMVRYDPAGPLLAYHPDAVPAPPETPEELLDWAEANPGKFTYAQPANSGPGRTFLMSLPYLLGDKDPKDPTEGWDKTWAYLAELGKYVTTYPASTSIASEQFGSGQLSITMTLNGIDMINRGSGTYAPTDQVAIFDDQHWVADAHYFMVPKGVSAEALYVDLKLVSYILDPAQQSLTLGTAGSLTSANMNVTPDQAAPENAAAIEKWGRPDFYPKAFASGETVAPLDPVTMQDAFEIWQREIGSKVGG